MLESDAHDARFSVQWDALKFSKIPNEVSAGPLVAGTKLVPRKDTSTACWTPLAKSTAVLGLRRTIDYLASKGDSRASEVGTVSFNTRALTFVIDPYVVEVTVGWRGKGPKTTGETSGNEDGSGAIKNVAVAPLGSRVRRGYARNTWVTWYAKRLDGFAQFSTVVAEDSLDIPITPEEGYSNHGLVRALVFHWVTAFQLRVQIVDDNGVFVAVHTSHVMGLTNHMITSNDLTPFSDSTFAATLKPSHVSHFPRMQASQYGFLLL